MPSVDFDLNNLIIEVQKRPILYDKTLNGDREKAWEDVSNTLSFPGKDCVYQIFRKI